MNFVVRKGETTRVDGPYAEAKEVVGGWAMLQYDSLGGASPASRSSPTCTRSTGPSARWSPLCARSPRRRRGVRRLTALPCGWTPPVAAPALGWPHGRDRTAEAITAAWREESARLVGALTRMTRDLDLAEDLAQDALVAALEQWPTDGVPDNPGGLADDDRQAPRRRPLPARRHPAPRTDGARPACPREEEECPTSTRRSTTSRTTCCG